MANRYYVVSTTALDLVASGTTVTSGNTQSSSFGVARTMVESPIAAGALLSGSRTWSIHYVVSAMATPYEMYFTLQRRNSSGVSQSESSAGTTRSATGTYDDNITWDSGTWAANDQLALVWYHRRPSGTGNKSGTIDANGSSYVDAPAPVNASYAPGAQAAAVASGIPTNFTISIVQTANAAPSTVNVKPATPGVAASVSIAKTLATVTGASATPGVTVDVQAGAVDATFAPGSVAAAVGSAVNPLGSSGGAVLALQGSGAAYVKQNTGEGGSQGTGVTVGNSGGASGDAFDYATSTITFDNTHSSHGTYAYKQAQATTEIMHLEYNATGDTLYTRFYLYFETNNTAAVQLHHFRSAGGSNARITIRVGANAQRLSIVDSANVAQQTAASPLVANTLYRIETKYVRGGVGVGSMEVRVFPGDSTTQDTNLSPPVATGISTDLGATTSFRTGVACLSGAGPFTAWFDDIAYGTTDWLGPYGAAAGATVAARASTTLPALEAGAGVGLATVACVTAVPGVTVTADAGVSRAVMPVLSATPAPTYTGEARAPPSTVAALAATYMPGPAGAASTDLQPLFAQSSPGDGALYIAIRGDGGTIEAGAQSFTVPSPMLLGRARLQLRRGATVPDNLVVEVVDSLTSSTPLATATFPASDLPGNSLPTWKPVDFSPPARLAGGQTYYVRLTRSGTRNLTAVGWVYEGTNNYAGGTAWQKDNGSWTSQAFDLSFVLEGVPIATATVPSLPLPVSVNLATVTAKTRVFPNWYLRDTFNTGPSGTRIQSSPNTGSTWGQSTDGDLPSLTSDGDVFVYDNSQSITGGMSAKVAATGGQEYYIQYPASSVRPFAQPVPEDGPEIYVRFYYRRSTGTIDGTHWLIPDLWWELSPGGTNTKQQADGSLSIHVSTWQGSFTYPDTYILAVDTWYRLVAHGKLNYGAGNDLFELSIYSETGTTPLHVITVNDRQFANTASDYWSRLSLSDGDSAVYNHPSWFDELVVTYFDPGRVGDEDIVRGLSANAAVALAAVATATNTASPTVSGGGAPATEVSLQLVGAVAASPGSAESGGADVFLPPEGGW